MAFDIFQQGNFYGVSLEIFLARKFGHLATVCKEKFAQHQFLRDSHIFKKI
jgi:hypothetical protein